MSLSDVTHAAYTTAETFDLIVIGMRSGPEVRSAGALPCMGESSTGLHSSRIECAIG